MPSSLDIAKSWIKIDPNHFTTSVVERLIEDAKAECSEKKDEAQEELSNLFPSDGTRIGFGTAGLRSEMKPGPLGMNDLVIIQATQGLARYVQENYQGRESEKPLAVVGYDHRTNPNLNLSSESFALLTKLVFLEAGFDCLLLDGFVPTPLVAFSTKELNASIGIMITASHNPKEDAGYKVYWKDGCQIRPPLDQGIAESILKKDNLQPWVDYDALIKAAKNNGHALKDTLKTELMANSYFMALKSSGLVIQKNSMDLHDRKVPRIAYTAMHGVGHPWAVKAFETFGLASFQSVPEQEEADPTFPTVAFPNPEEKGALNLAKEFAVQKECDIVFANDPDADRLGVAEKCRETGAWTIFKGDQIGVMLGHFLWEKIGKTSTKVRLHCSRLNS
jgi:phosphomannomutase